MESRVGDNKREETPDNEGVAPYENSIAVLQD